MSSRRRFIRQLSASSLSIPFLGKLQPDYSHYAALPASDKPLRVVMMGLGSYAERVANAMQDCKMAKLVGGITGTPAKVGAWAKKYKLSNENFYSYEDFAQIKNNPNVDAIYITTPNVLHKAHVIKAAKTGKHIICEKPMAANAKDALDMIEACQKAGVKLFIGYRMHFEPFTRELIRMREAGELGRIMHVNAYFGFKIGDPTQWRLRKDLAGGGALMDVGVYCINAARYATGEEPVWITAQESKTDPVKFKEVDETITWQMGFPSGVIASCSTTYNFNDFERLYVVGDKGFVELSPAYGYGPIKGRSHKGEMRQPVVTHQTYQMDGMADCLLNGKPDPNVTGEEGLKDMKIIDAIYKSIAAGGKKIELK